MPRFQFSMVNHGPKLLNRKFQKSLTSFKLHIVLNRMINSHTILLSPALDINHPFVYRIVPSSHLALWVTRLSWYRDTCVQPLFYLMLAPKHRWSATVNSYMPKRSHKVLPLSEKEKVLDSIRKISYAEVAKVYCKKKSWRRKKKIIQFCCHPSDCKSYVHRARSG